MRPLTVRLLRIGRNVILGGIVVVTGGSGAYLATKSANTSAGQAAASKNRSDQPEKIRRIGPDAVLVPETVAHNIGLRNDETVTVRKRPMQVPGLQGCLALDSNQLVRVHSRFAGEVVTLGTRDLPVGVVVSSQKVSPEIRSVRVGDTVHKGELLAVVWSKDLGEKKSELVDAVSRLRADEVTHHRLEAAYGDGSVPERSLRDAERTVESDRIAVEKAERTLRAWRVTETEIAAIRTEADRTASRPDPSSWARVEVRAPQDGVILEKNVTVGDIVDTTADLFKIGDLSHLLVWASVYEEDLPLLQSLKAQAASVRWSVQLPSRPGTTFPGQLDQISAVIDPNQHTALVTGRVENPHGELKAGQFVTVVVDDLPVPTGELELPASAVVEDGRDSFVFVRPAGREEWIFVRKPVQVTQRFRDVVCLKADGSIAAGDRIATGAALLLKDAMAELPAPRQ